MRVSVFGLGYVGSVSAACLAQAGHEVVGVDVNPVKVEIINDGRSPVIETGLSELIGGQVAVGCLRATTDATSAVLETDISLVCVGTPSNTNGSLNLDFVERVCQDIGRALEQKKGYHVVVVRSTLLPGTTETLVIPTLELASGQKAGVDFGVCYNPEFLREGTSLNDFYHPPFTLIGQNESQAGDVTKSLYASLDAPLLMVSYRVAEMVKYVSNTFHALKICFANEIGNICKREGIDGHEVMDIFCLDRKLNISPAYLKPGFAFGGSCLPKDLRALLYRAGQLDLHLPVLEAVLPSNEKQLKHGIGLIRATGKKKIGVLGFSFKAGTDDLRESPMVELIETLIGKGYQVCVYDHNVSLAQLHGANKAYIEREIPHIAKLIRTSLEEVLSESEVIVIGHRAKEFNRVPELAQNGQIVIDLVRIMDDLPSVSDVYYNGICW